MSESKKLLSLIQRNIKCYFKDKMIFLVSLITPLILLLLFVTFLRNVYLNSIKDLIPDGYDISGRIIEGLAGSWLISSIIAVSSVTVAFCSNIVMVQDKLDGTLNDFKISPVKSYTLTLAYFISNFIVTLLVLLCVLVIGFVYIGAVGWYIPIGDGFMILADTVLCTLFGTLMSAVFLSFVRSQGALNGISTLISSVYGFIIGAYMPLSRFSSGLRTILCCLPGTYGVGILRNHFMNGYLDAIADCGVTEEAVLRIKDGFDGNLYVGSTQIPLWAMYVILLGTCLVLAAAFIALVLVRNGKTKLKQSEKRVK